MTRTIISLDEADKKWPDREAKRRKIPRTRLIQIAVRKLRESGLAEPPTFEELLERTHGIWKGGEDGLAYQRRIRKEWDHRP
jgi:hypothetical protein